jgi:hypothetical protein
MSITETIPSTLIATDKVSIIPIDVAKRVAECINNCEASIDHAYVATAEFAMLMPVLRGQARVSFGAPQDAIAKATEALGLLAQAREAIKISHKDLDKVARHSGLDPRTVSEFPWTKGGPGG